MGTWKHTPGLEAGPTLGTRRGEAETRSYPDPSTLHGVVAVGFENLKPPECPSKEAQRRSGVRHGRRHGARGACGLWAGPGTSGPHLVATPQSDFQSRETSAAPEGSHTSIRETQTNTRPGGWLPRRREETAPPQHTEPERKWASDVACGGCGGRLGGSPSQETLAAKGSSKTGPPWPKAAALE